EGAEEIKSTEVQKRRHSTNLMAGIILSLIHLIIRQKSKLLLHHCNNHLVSANQNVDLWW
ncbi:MAG TPA: hypothetical protein DCS35_08880, partial [Vibrio sp.]|nr:hypothetical protein [Vibrio sp.]